MIIGTISMQIEHTRTLFMIIRTTLIDLQFVHDYRDYIKPTSIFRDLLMTIWTTSTLKI
jgi:hypothetical protein